MYVVCFLFYVYLYVRVVLLSHVVWNYAHSARANANLNLQKM